MSLNKLTNQQIGKDIKLDIGCVNMSCTNMISTSHDSGDITADKITMHTVDLKELDFEFNDVGLPGEVLHTDGQNPASVYWGPDLGGGSGIGYSGASTDIGRHLKSASADGLTANNSLLIEDATTLDLGTLKAINATDPTNDQDLATKKYVDDQAVIIENKKQFSTGLLSGGNITINGGDTTKFDVSAGTGIIVNPSTGLETPVSWINQTAISILGGQKTTYITLNSIGVINKSSSPISTSLQRQEIYLGDAHTPDTINIVAIDNQPNVVVNGTSSLFDLANSINHLNLSGNVISSNSGLTIQKTLGSAFGMGCNFELDVTNPNVVTLNSLDSSTDNLRYYMKNCSTSSALTTINPNNKDNGTNYPGVSMTAGFWSVQRVYSSCSVSNKLNVMLGQFEYELKSDAINNINSEGFDDSMCAVINKDCLIGLILVQQGTTDLINAEFLPVNKFGQSTKIDTDLNKIQNIVSSSQAPDITNLDGVIRTGTIPTNNNDLTNKLYVDNADNLKLDKSGGTVTGLLTLNNNINVLGDYQKNNVIGNLPLELNASTNLICGGAQSINTVNTTVYGQEALESSLTGASNSAFGYKAMKGYRGSSSVGIGQDCLIAPLSTGGIFNVGIGTIALQNQVSSSLCTAVGFGALSGCTVGVNNTCIGGGSGGGLSTDITNESNATLIGANTKSAGFESCIVIGSSGASTADQQATLANVNVIRGTIPCDLGNPTDNFKDIYLSGNYIQNGINASLPLNRGDPSNIITGDNAGLSITTGINNCGYGNNAMTGLTIQDNNTSYGESSMNQYKGESSVAIGWRSMLGSNSVSGSGNVALGPNSYNNHTTGSNNFALGSGALFSATTGNSNIAIGTFASDGITTESETIAIGNDARCDGFNSCIALGAGSANTKNNQCVIKAIEIVSSFDNQCDLGSVTKLFKDLYLGGKINGKTPVGGLFSGTSASVEYRGDTQGTAETSILPITFVGSLSIPANVFTPGDCYHMVISGNIACANNQTLTLRVKGTGSLLATLVNTFSSAVSAPSFFETEIDFQIQAIGAGGVAKIVSNVDFTYNDVGSFLGSRNISTNTTTFDTTIQNTLEITAEWSSTNASNTIQTLLCVMTEIY